jgi:hypothetical protein
MFSRQKNTKPTNEEDEFKEACKLLGIKNPKQLELLIKA